MNDDFISTSIKYYILHALALSCCGGGLRLSVSGLFHLSPCPARAAFSLHLPFLPRQKPDAASAPDLVIDCILHRLFTRNCRVWVPSRSMMCRQRRNQERRWAKLLGIAQRKEAKCPRVPVFSVLSQQRFLDVPGVLQELRSLTSCAMYGLQQQWAAVVPQTKGLVARGVVTRLYLGEKRNLPTRSKRLRPEVEAIFRLRCGICASKCQGSLISSGLSTRTCYDSGQSVVA